MYRLAGYCLLVLFALSCSKPEWEWPSGTVPPPGFPPVPIPVDNASLPDRVELGRRLFFDPVMSADSTLSCGHCHRPERAFADDRPVSPGIEGRLGTRNAPSLANVAYQKALLREGGVPTLEMQVLVPVQEHAEFDANILEIADRISRIPVYRTLALKAYDREPDAWVITRAIAAFERTLTSGQSSFDAWAYQGDLKALSPGAVRGYLLFTGDRLNCATCHSGFLFTDQSFRNNGLYLEYKDPGRERLTGLASDLAMFKVPSLRNVAVTAPYMHDGSLADLDAVIDHYQSGGQPHPNKSPDLKPFLLTPREREDLKSFLQSLTDPSFLTNPHIQPF